MVFHKNFVWSIQIEVIAVITGLTTFVESSNPQNQTSITPYSTSLFSNNKKLIKVAFSKKENFNFKFKILFKNSTNSFSVISQESVINLSFKSSKCG